MNKFDDDEARLTPAKIAVLDTADGGVEAGAPADDDLDQQLRAVADMAASESIAPVLAAVNGLRRDVSAMATAAANRPPASSGREIEALRQVKAELSELLPRATVLFALAAAGMAAICVFVGIFIGSRGYVSW